ncbi:hypothetical protein GCM10010269_46900 [Streptomyces humidus]|uniref:Uncharacterized protein n=1 Tax=Streptomyces humidus TaxID=52259 RepID=A0A918FZ48_9ACTN|nr:hypothetical protein [Streptomyces humidus]GGS02646.1 hypothetical protein GCM10010269_46900 [Streptomyces humidus]
MVIATAAPGPPAAVALSLLAHVGGRDSPAPEGAEPPSLLTDLHV